MITDNLLNQLIAASPFWFTIILILCATGLCTIVALITCLIKFPPMFPEIPLPPTHEEMARNYWNSLEAFEAEARKRERK